jgi:hypothetical protein
MKKIRENSTNWHLATESLSNMKFAILASPINLVECLVNNQQGLKSWKGQAYFDAVSATKKKKCVF